MDAKDREAAYVGDACWPCCPGEIADARLVVRSGAAPDAGDPHAAAAGLVDMGLGDGAAAHRQGPLDRPGRAGDLRRQRDHGRVGKDARSRGAGAPSWRDRGPDCACPFKGTRRGGWRVRCQVDPSQHTARDVGDEPLMLAGQAPVWISRDRAAKARRRRPWPARRSWSWTTGHQNPSLRKALSRVVVDGETRDDDWPFGDGVVFPLWPYARAPARRSRARRAVVLLLAADLPEGGSHAGAATGGTAASWWPGWRPSSHRPAGPGGLRPA